MLRRAVERAENSTARSTSAPLNHCVPDSRFACSRRAEIHAIPAPAVASAPITSGLDTDMRQDKAGTDVTGSPNVRLAQRQAFPPVRG